MGGYIHGDPIIDDGKAVSEIFYSVAVGDVNSDFITFLDGKVRHAKGGCHSKHVDMDFVDITNNGGCVVQIDAIDLCLLACIFPHGVVPIPDVDWFDDRTMDNR